MSSLFLLAVVATFVADTSEIGRPEPELLESRLKIPRMSARLDGMPMRPTVQWRDCEEILLKNSTASDGVYTVRPEQFGRTIEVECNMHGDGSTLILKRFSGSDGYNEAWELMKNGIGNLNAEFWLGLEDVYHLTNSGNYSVMIEITEGSHNWTEIYNSFALSDETQDYRLRVEDFDSDQSTNNDSALAYSNNFPFSTYDKDNTGSILVNCPRGWEAPGWYDSDCRSRTFPFSSSTQTAGGWGMRWVVHGREVLPAKLSMKIRRRKY